VVNFRDKRVGGPLALLIAIVVTATMALTTAGTATGSSAPAGATASSRTVAQNAKGELRSRIVGQTGNGREVTGYFVPLNFTRKDGKVFARGLIHGVVHNNDGSVRTFDVIRKKRVLTIEGAPVRTRTQAAALAAAPCDILNLVLGPLDLDLLGLQVHLDRIVLNIVAQSGAGNLLGNLLCAVAGLLDGGLAGQLGRLTDLLNRILGLLGLGL
jgi:hypothetical protein